MRFAVLGRTSWLHRSALAAQAAGHELVLVGTLPPSAEDPVGVEDYRALAVAAGAPFFTGRVNAPETVALAREAGAQVAVSANWIELIGAEMRDAFPWGVVNIHPGDLPRYRGNACPNWAILNGEDSVVVTLHQMVDELDAGPVLLKGRMPLESTTTITDVITYLNTAVPDLVVELLEGIAAGSIVARPQPEATSLASRCHARLPRDGEIDWRERAIDVDRLVRSATRPYPGAYTWYHEANTGPIRRLTVWRAHVADPDTPVFAVPGSVLRIAGEENWAVATGDGGAVVLDDVDVDGEPADPGRTFRSSRQRLGLDLVSVVVALEERVAALERAMVGRSTDEERSL